MIRPEDRFAINPLNYLSREDMQTIHSAAMKILEEEGVEVYHEKAVEMLSEAGAFIEENDSEEGTRVYIPTHLAEWALDQPPSRVTLYDREGEASLYLERRNAYYGTGSDCPYLLDSFTGERRAFEYEDVEDAVRLVDSLDNIDFAMSMGLISDVDKQLSYQHEFALMLRHTTKPHVITAGDRASLKDQAEMAAAVRGGMEELKRKPIFALYDEPTSPLMHSFEAVDKLLYMAENSLPTNYSPGMMAGSTGPITMAGAMTQANAEIISGLVIHQLKNPGAPFIYGAGTSPVDMNSMQPTYSAPEAVVSQAGLTEIGRELYELPTWGFAGCSSSKLADSQAVYEASNYMMMAGVTGTNLIHDVGYLESGMTFSFDLLVMCDEIIGQIRRMMDGIMIDEEYLALDAIGRVGPGGHYLGDEHTFNHFKENWQPELTDRDTFENWQERGSTSMLDRTREKIEDILENHETEKLSAEADKKIDAIIAEAAEREKVSSDESARK